MFIPPSGFHKPDQKSSDFPPVCLESCHLLLRREVAEAVFGPVDNVLLAYYPDKGRLMLAAATNEEFKAIHKASQHMLKSRNAKGDKSIAIHELLIDHQLDDQNRELDYEMIPGLGIVSISFK